MNTQFDAAWQFFIGTFSELVVLFVLISMLVIWLQAKFPADTIRKLLSGGAGYFTAAGLGAMTPFCSCSTLPMLVGLLRAKADFGPVMTFLLVSPLLNPLLVVLLWVTFGAELTLIYSLAILLLAVSAGMLLQHAGFLRYVSLPAVSGCQNSGCSDAAAQTTAMPGLWLLFKQALQQSVSFLPHLLFGVLAGALIHGYMPSEWLAATAGQQPWWLIPTAAAVGVLLYVRASSMIPLAMSLVAKGVSLGTVMALTIGGAGASLPELIILKRIFQWPLLLVFIFLVFGTACVTGFSIDFWFAAK